MRLQTSPRSVKLIFWPSRTHRGGKRARGGDSFSSHWAPPPSKLSPRSPAPPPPPLFQYVGRSGNEQPMSSSRLWPCSQPSSTHSKLLAVPFTDAYTSQIASAAGFLLKTFLTQKAVGSRTDMLGVHPSIKACLCLSPTMGVRSYQSTSPPDPHPKSTLLHGPCN